MSNFIDNDISLFINDKNKDKFFKDFNDNFKDKKRDKKRDFNDKKRDFNDNFNDITVSLFTGIENNISICIVEVPNETAPSIQGFAKPPA